MRSVYCKARARKLRWKEEITLLLEEMRRTVAYLLWRRDWWLSKRDLRPDARADITRGANAYAERQATIFEIMAVKFARRWKATVTKCGLLGQWPLSIDRGIDSLRTPSSPSTHMRTPPSAPFCPPTIAISSNSSTPNAPSSLDAATTSNAPLLEPNPSNPSPSHATLSSISSNEHGGTHQTDVVVDAAVNLEGDDEEDDAEISDAESDGADDIVGYLGPEGYDSD